MSVENVNKKHGGSELHFTFLGFHGLIFAALLTVLGLAGPQSQILSPDLDRAGALNFQEKFDCFLKYFEVFSNHFFALF